MDNKKKWGIKAEEIKSPQCPSLESKWKRAEATMRLRTKDHELFSRISHNQNIFEKKEKDSFSEGSTQTAKRKLRAQTIQRIPDGKLISQYDKNSVEAIQLDFIFEHKVLTSEYDGKDMLKNVWKTFNDAYDYGFGCVRTGFEKDLDGDPRISYKHIKWSDIFPDPDCDCIEEAAWYFHRDWVSYDVLEALIDCDGNIADKTYNEKTVKYIVENKISDGQDMRSVPLGDQKKGVMKLHSVEVKTFYKRGADKFITYVPSIEAILREVDNCDPRKDIPLHFLILEPDNDFPLGISQIMWTLAQQQFADAFQSVSYETMLRANRPPLQVFGNLPNPKIRMMPGAIWPMGTNPNNKIEPFQVETSTLVRYGEILEQVSAGMMKSLGVLDGTVASDAKQNYSATPQGVEAQREDKTINVNQLQKRVEIFFAEWASHALRSYVKAMSGTKKLTVDEETRRKIFDVQPDDEDSLIDENKIEIDFTALGSEAISFEVRTGSLVQNKTQDQIDNIQSVLIPLTQMLGNLSEENHAMFEDKVILPLVQNWLEKADIDISSQISEPLAEKVMMDALMQTMQTVQGQQGQIDQLGGQQAAMAGAMPPEQQAMLPPEMMAGAPPQGAMPPMPPQPETQLGQGLPPEMGMPPEQGIPPMGASDMSGMLGGQEELPPEEVMPL